MTDTILVDKVLSDVVCKHEINARLEQIDIATWLSNMSEDEFRRCCPTGPTILLPKHHRWSADLVSF